MKFEDMPEPVRKELEALGVTYNFLPEANRTTTAAMTDGSAYRCIFWKDDFCLGRITVQFDWEKGVVTSRKVEKALPMDMGKVN